MKLFIKYMVSIRCKMVVKAELDKLGLHFTKVDLGEVYRLKYSSVAHLSSQFKKVTGLTPTYFKQLKNKKRIALENV